VSVAAWAAVGLIGGVAAGARFLLDSEVTARLPFPFPFGILAVNLSGALAIGILAGAGVDGDAYAIAAGGAVGSFTTFSTWILDSHRLGTADRAELAWLNLGLSLLGGLLAVSLGHWLGELL
jgi:CrcB protein